MAFLSKWCCASATSHKYSREPSEEYNSWRIFSFKELHAATNNFNYDNKIGEGVFGSVYWGQLCDRSQIAVKWLKVWSSKAEMEFALEVEILGRVRHKNLLSLRGYCAEGQERLIVFNYMPNLSLTSHLRGQLKLECHLDWRKRIIIALGSAEGLAHLHYYATPNIIHRDVKASNVLLDSNFEAQVADFGFAKLIPEGASHVTTGVKGTLAYIAPEYAMWGKASKSCDVYSFGTLLLELLSGRKPWIDIVEWVTPLVSEGNFEELADPMLQGNYNIEELRRLLHVATKCVQEAPGDRPTMLEVVELLKDLRDGDSLKTQSQQNGNHGKQADDEIICLTSSKIATPVVEVVQSKETYGIC